MSQSSDKPRRRKGRHHQEIEDGKDVVIEHDVKIAGYGRPIEEVDPTVTEDTFCVISKKFGKHYVFRFSCESSLYLFSPSHGLRKLAVYIITHRFFDIVIITTIFANCITLAMNTNHIDENGEKIRSTYDPETDIIEYFFLLIYIVEMMLKIIAKGFVLHKFSYLRSFWNILDFVVISTGIQGVIVEVISAGNDEPSSGFQALRTIRVFRAIKTVTILPGLRFIINVLINSTFQLMEVMTLTCCCLMIFSLFAMEVYMGNMLQKCVLIKGGVADPESFPIDLEPPHSRDYLWYKWVTNESHWRQRDPGYPHAEPMPCGNDTSMRTCPEGYTCLKDIGDNFDNGWTSFDSFFRSMLTTLQILTLDFMERPMELILSTSGPWSILFLFIVIFLGAFYLLNLMVAVVTMSYEHEAHKLVLNVTLSKQQKLNLHKTASTFSFHDPSKLNPIVLTYFRRKTPSEKELMTKKRKSTSNDPADQPEFQAVGDGDRKGRSLGDAILGILGRRYTLEVEFAKFDMNGPHPDNVVVADDEIRVRPRIVNTKPEPDKGNVAIQGQPDPKDLEHRVTFTGVTGTEPKKEGASDADYLTDEGEVDVEDSENETVFPKINTRKWERARMIKRLVLYLRLKLMPIVNHSMFETFITGCIICNTILLAVEHDGQPEEMKNVLERGNQFFLVIFGAECLLKLLAMQKEYFASGWNRFDVAIIVLSVVDIILEKNFNFPLIKGMRLLRVIKLAQSWLTMKVLLNIIFSTFGELGNLTMVMVMIIYIFAVLGMHVVGSEYSARNFGALDDTTKFPRWNWSNFGLAFVMVFRIICGEWIEPLLECLQAHKHANSEHKCFFIYLLTSIVGNLVVLNLFLALLLNSFDTDELNAQREKELEKGKSDNLKKIVGMLMKKGKTENGDKKLVSSQNSRFSVTIRRSSATGVSGAEDEPKESLARVRFKMITKRVIMKNRKEIAEQAIERSEKRFNAPNHDTSEARRSSFGLIHDNDCSSSEGSEVKVAGDCIPRKYLECHSYLCNKLRGLDWTTWDKMRSYAVCIVNHPTFEWGILGLIFLSSITLCFEDIHFQEDQQLKYILFIMNCCFTAIFFIEMILKIFSLGMWGYCTNAWTILDAFIVVVSLVTLYYDIHMRLEHMEGPRRKTKNLNALKALRTLRALRPLRAISRWQGMKIVVNALMYAIPSIFNVLLVCLLFWLVFAIMGVQFFKGKFYKCVNQDGETVDSSLAATKEICCAKADSMGYSWINSDPNFDNVGKAYLALLQIATYEGWMEQMELATDLTDIDQQPERYNSAYFYAFFGIFIVFGGFFVLNLFIGVIIDTFNTLKKKYEGSLLDIFLTPSQRHYYATMQKLGRKKPHRVIRRPFSNLLSPFYDMAMSRRLEVLVFSMIFLNLCVMAFESYKQAQFYIDILAGINSFFTIVYALEAIIKLFGLRQYYFTVPWNIFDFVLVMASLKDLFYGDDVIKFPIPPQMLRVIRIVRIGRILRLIKSAKGIRKLLFALVVSLPALFNIGALLALITFIYAILGMALFLDAPLHEAVDQMLNFRTFMNSGFMLIRLMTSAGWNDVLTGLTYTTAVCGSYRTMQCGLEGEPECPNYAMAVGYLVTYIIISFQIVINMYIAIILENFDEASKEEEIGIIEDDLDMFYVHWSRYDPTATQFIGFEQLSEFLANLDPPLNLPKPNIVAIVAFNLPICRGNKIHCLDVLHALVKHVLGQIDDSPDFRKLQDQMEKKFQKQFPTRKLLDIICSTRIWKIQQNAAIIIQRAWRAYYKRTHLRITDSKSNTSTQ